MAHRSATTLAATLALVISPAVLCLAGGSPARAAETATVRALEETVLLEVERRDLVPLLEANPRLLEQLGALVSARQQELERFSAAAASQRSGWLVDTMRQLFAGLGVR